MGELETRPLSIESLPARTLPTTAPRRTAPRWAVRLHSHLVQTASGAGLKVRNGAFYDPPESGLLPAATAAFQSLPVAARHGSVSHVRSSQAFALNLFAPIEPDDLVALCRRLDIAAVSAGPVRFEVGDPDGLLCEATVRSAHTTQIDVVIPAELEDGTRHLLAVEVKLSETDFGHCTAWSAQSNDSRDVCGSGLPFGGAPERCFQLRNLDRGPRRRYDDYLSFPQPATSTAGCWFRDGTNQIMRNVALLNAMTATGQADAATFVLCAPLEHSAIWRRWREGTDRLAGQGVTLAELPADPVIAHHPDIATAVSLAERYLLDSRLPLARKDRLAWQSRLDSAFPNGAAVAILSGPNPYFAQVDPRPIVHTATSDACIVEVGYPGDTRPPVWLQLDNTSFRTDTDGRIIAVAVDTLDRRLVQPQTAQLTDDWREMHARDRPLRDPHHVRDEYAIAKIGLPDSPT